MTKRTFVAKTIAAAGLAVAIEHGGMAQGSCHATPYWVTYFELAAGLIAVVDCTVITPAACDVTVGLLPAHRPEVAVRTLGRGSGANACAGSPGHAGETAGMENARAQ